MKTTESVLESKFLMRNWVLAWAVIVATAGAPSIVRADEMDSSKPTGIFSDIKTTASADFVSDVYTSAKEDRAFGVNVRSAEFMLYGPIDHLFDGTLNFAGHTEDGEFNFELHEGFVSSSKLIPSSRLRAGKFFLGVGRLNQFHQHDWNFTTAPKSHETFFAEEGAADTGLEYTYLFPTDRFIEVTLGVTNNRCYGHCHGGGKKPPRPLYYVHPVTFFDFSSQSGLQLGVSYLNRKDDLQVETHLMGVDLTFKQRRGKLLKWLVQTEVYYQDQAGGSSEALKQLGGYALTQYGLSESWSSGLRFDAFSELSKKFQTTNGRRKDLDYAIVPILTWKPSEFSTLRFSYTYDVDTTQGDEDRRNHLAQVQFNYILGAHPAHDF
jgi:hypothetical protein